MTKRKNGNKKSYNESQECVCFMAWKGIYQHLGYAEDNGVLFTLRPNYHKERKIPTC